MLQQLSLLRKEGVVVWDGGCDSHLVVGVLLVHYAVVEQQATVWLGPTPGKDRLTCNQA